MNGLPSELYNRCRGTLLRCHEFDSDAALRAVFVTEELAPFQGGLPDAGSKNGRVDACVAYLLSKRLRDRRPVLPVFLAALSDRYRPGDALRDELRALHQAVQSAMVQTEIEPGVSPAPVSQLGWNTSAVRDLLTVAFSDEGVDTLCFDHFHSVYDNFSSGMSKGQKIQHLMDYCSRHQQFEKLLSLVQDRNPAQYARFESHLEY